MHSRLEQYLNEVAGRLGPLPAKARVDELREMRAHLETAFAAGLERGQSEDEAARGVLEQFGTPDVVSTETVAAWRRGVRLDWRSFWGAAAFALFVPYFLWGVTIMALMALPGAPHGWSLAIPLFYLLLVRLLKGSLVSLLFPRLGPARLGVAVGLSCVLLGFLTGFSLLGVFVDVLISVSSALAVRRWRTARTARVGTYPSR